MAQLSQVAAAGCLLGAGTATELAGRVPGVTVTEAVTLWLRELYPPDRDGELGVTPPRPARGTAREHGARFLPGAG